MAIAAVLSDLLNHLKLTLNEGGAAPRGKSPSSTGWIILVFLRLRFLIIFPEAVSAVPLVLKSVC